MKKSLMVVSVLAGAMAAFGDTTSTAEGANVYGLLKINSTAVRTIISVPWVDPGVSGGSGISVTNIIKTTDLTAGDQLYYYNGSSFDCWKLKEDKTWEAAKQVSSAGGSSDTDSSDRTLMRGNAIMLIRANDDTSLAKPIVVFGQVSADTTVTNSISAGSTSTPSYTLIAAPSVKDGTINLSSTDDVVWENVNANDRIYIQHSDGAMPECKYDDGTWKEYIKTGTTTQGGRTVSVYEWVSATNVECGVGFWYKCTGAAPTVTWKNIPSTSNN